MKERVEKGAGRGLYPYAKRISMTNNKIINHITMTGYDKYAQEAIELLTNLIKIPSISRQEDAAADYMQQWMQERGLNPTRVKNNLWLMAEDYTDKRPTLLLNAHIDTVRPAEGWTKDPFTPTVDGDHLYGLGSNDCGGGLVTLLQVFRILKDQKRSFNLIYAASAEEEVSGKEGFTLLRESLPQVDVAIVGEPTGMQPAIAEKGLMVVDVTVHGKAGHAAREEGINAIYKAIDQINWIRNLKFPKISPTLGQMKLTATIIQGGTLHNIIPDTCNYTVDIRTTDLYTNQEVLDYLCAHLEADVRARSTRLGSSCIPENHPLVRRCVEMGMKPFGSPTLSDQALMPWPSMKLGPGQSARSHTANEYILLSEIKNALHTYLALLNGVEITTS